MKKFVVFQRKFSKRNVKSSIHKKNRIINDEHEQLIEK